jgi:hypothetical protein
MCRARCARRPEAPGPRRGARGQATGAQQACRGEAAAHAPTGWRRHGVPSRGPAPPMFGVPPQPQSVPVGRPPPRSLGRQPTQGRREAPGREARGQGLRDQCER